MVNFDIPFIVSGDLINTSNHIQYYGMINESFPSGRPNDSERIELRSFIDLMRSIQQSGGDINYLLNGYIGNLELNYFKDYFQWIIAEVNPEVITFSEPQVYQFLKSKFNSSSFEISSITGISNESEFSNFIEKGGIDISDIKKIVLHHDHTITGTKSIEFIHKLKSLSIEPRVLVTESCYYNCPFRQKHYKSLINAFKYPKQLFIDYFQIDCIIRRLKYPETLLDLSGFLLPEQLKSYSENTSINAFKISGRSKSSKWIYNTAQAYINQISPENLYDIIVFTSPFLTKFNMDIQNLFYLDSKSYFEFSEDLKQVKEKGGRALFIKEKAMELFNSNKLRINDPGSIYTVKDDKIKIIQKGEYFKYLEKVILLSQVSNSSIRCICND